MLKRDGTQAHEALASLEASQPKAGDIAFPDYHHEAREYEKKLIQVSYILSLFLKPEVSTPQIQYPVIEHNMAI
jgi:hypothetical protein